MDGGLAEDDLEEDAGGTDDQREDHDREVLEHDAQREQRASRSSRWLRAVVTYNQMVVGSEESKTDDVFHALADPTRRDILRRAGGGAPSVSRLADAYPMSFAAVQKHVAVLERAGLVTKRRRGREQLVEAAPEGLADARRALEDLEAIWRGRVERMSELLASDSEQDERKP